MDKQTLSNYGWLVIVTLILAIMLAFATPFGTYVGDGVVSIANGFVGASDQAIDEDNISKLEDKWSDKMDWSATGNENYILIGDVNQDGVINQSDVERMQEILVGTYTAPIDEYTKTLADVNKDGNINAADLVTLKLYIGGQPAESIGNKFYTNNQYKKTLIGDVKKNGKVDAGDLGYLKQILSGFDMSIYNDCDTVAADLNIDGSVNSTDLAIMKLYLAGTIDTSVKGYNYIGNEIILEENSGIKQDERAYLLIGDVNQNGTIDEKDKDALTNIVAGRTISVPIQEYTDTLCDVNKDGVVDTVDLAQIKLYNAGASASHNIGEKIYIDSKYKPVLIGDIKKDGKINSDDTEYLKKINAGLSLPSDGDMKAADVNFDGTVDTTDLALIKLFVAETLDDTSLVYLGRYIYMS